jgi:oligopeptide transport system substrate-binding protein
MTLSVQTAICMIILFLAGCGRNGDRADLVFINGAEPESLDPAIITGQPEGRIVNALFEGLCAYDEHGNAIPGVAEHWEISADGLTYTFHLRNNAKWSDGSPLTATDFVESWRRTLTPATGSQYNYQLHPVKNARAFSEGKTTDGSEVGVRAADEKTLIVDLEHPTPYFIQLCAFPTLHPVPVRLIEKLGDDWIKPGNLVGNGAYTLERWGINDRIRLRKNLHYWDHDRVPLETIDILPISEANVAFNFYASGLADLLMDKGLAPPALLDDLKKRPDFHAAPFLGTYFLRFNCEKGPFTDERVRKAFSLAVDKSRIVEKITRAGESAAQGFVPPGIPRYTGTDGLPYDPATAARLLAEAGYPNGEGFPTATYLYSKSELNEAIAVELQSMWRDTLGVTVNLLRQEWKVYLNSLSLLDYDIARSSWVGDYPDPNTFLDMFLTGGGNNRTGWSSKAYDDLIAKAATELDPSRRFEILREAEDLLVQESVPVCPIYYYVGIQLYDSEALGGIHANVLDEHPLRRIYKKSFPPPARIEPTSVKGLLKPTRPDFAAPAALIHGAAQEMAVEGFASGKPGHGWPADIATGSTVAYLSLLVENGYLAADVSLPEKLRISNLSDSDRGETAFLDIPIEDGARFILRKDGESAIIENQSATNNFALPPARDPAWLP